MSHREHDERRIPEPDDAIADLWREVSAEAPPPLVDARILAAARGAIARREPDASAERLDKPHSRAPWTWRPLLAAAAVAGIAFAILPPMLRQAEGPVRPTVERDTNAPAVAQVPSSAAPTSSAAPAGPGPVTAVTAPVERESPGPDSVGVAAAKSAESAAPMVPQHVAAQDGARSVAAPVPAPPVATAEAQNAGEPAAVTGGSGALSRADRVFPSAPAALSKSPALDAPTDRAAKIAALYESGDVTAAAEELRAFRTTRPDADTYLPGTLQDWARTVK